MTEQEYREGEAFIVKNSSTEEEAQIRLKYWREQASKLVGKSLLQASEQAGII